jgi:hypothetical protein
MQEQPDPGREGQQLQADHEEALYAALQHTQEQKESRRQKAKRYLGKWNDIVPVLTLLFVAAYTVVTFNIFFVGNRAFMYFDKAIVEIVDRPIRPQVAPGVVVANPPSVTEKVVAISFSLMNAGNTPTRNMRVVLDCEPVGFAALTTDPFLKFNRSVTPHPEIAGPKQQIIIGPCETSTAGDTMLYASNGFVPIILMGEIRYEDRVAWGRWSKHVTQFSQRLIVTHYDPANNKIVATTQSIGAHNCADEDCPE